MDDMVGFAYDALKQASFNHEAERLLLVQYESLTTGPIRSLDAIYDFIGEQAIAHYFVHVDYDDAAFEQRIELRPTPLAVGPVPAICHRRTLVRSVQTSRRCADPSIAGKKPSSDRLRILRNFSAQSGSVIGFTNAYVVLNTDTNTE